MKSIGLDAFTDAVLKYYHAGMVTEGVGEANALRDALYRHGGQVGRRGGGGEGEGEGGGDGEGEGEREGEGEGGGAFVDAWAEGEGIQVMEGGVEGGSDEDRKSTL